MRDAVHLLQDMLPKNACIVCPWGENGACGKDAKGNIFEVPCYPPQSGIRYSKFRNVSKIALLSNIGILNKLLLSYHFHFGKVIDTLGAGDNFNAAVIADVEIQDVFEEIGAKPWLNLGIDLKQAIAKGCKVAGTKIVVVGFSELLKMHFDWYLKLQG